MISVLVLCVLVVSIDAAAYKPVKCCSPTAYTAVLLENGGIMYNGQPMATDFITHMTFDYNEGMVRLDRTGLGNDMKPLSYSLLQDYRKGVMYYIQGNVCSPSPFNLPLYSPCLQDDAVFSGRHVIGSYGSHLSVDSWSFPPISNLTTTLAVSSDDCLPVVITTTGTYNGEPLQNVLVYTNITIGSVDQSKFAVPFMCNQ